MPKPASPSCRWIAASIPAPCCWRNALAIGARETAGELHDRLAALGATAILKALDGLAAGGLRPVPQPAEGITYAAKISPAEARLDWRKPAIALERAVRAFNPVPGAWLELDGGERMKVLAAMAVEGRGAPGTLSTTA